jgi:hypothetical protein
MLIRELFDCLPLDGQGPIRSNFIGRSLQFGASVVGMPPLLVSRGRDGELVINDGVTRATRVAKLLPGVAVRVEVIDDLPIPVGGYPSVGDLLP